ncbi:MAG: methyltransferase domain-containing protein [Microbacteriaceae bacterium]|nr:methyltransferase domain-containing protein [Microbacteriaceae bacterium]
MAEHYFSESPSGDFKQREISVTLAGLKVKVKTAGSVFSPEHVDQGTQVLLDHLDLAIPSGTFLDLGCGWGPIALSLALHSPKATVYAVDVNERSLELTKINAEALPIRVGKAVLHEMLQLWIPRLAPGGSAFLVVQKNLGSDSLQKWLEAEFSSGFEISRLTSVKTFRILKVTRT